jgi:hypothetical protein
VGGAKVVVMGTEKDKVDPCVEECVDECFNHLMGGFKDTEPGIVAFRLLIAVAAFPFFTILTLACANGCMQEKCVEKRDA